MEASTQVPMASVTLLWLASNAIYYMTAEPSMPHMVSMFAVSLLMSIWFLRIYREAVPGWAIAAGLGLAGGLVAGSHTGCPDAVGAVR